MKGKIIAAFAATLLVIAAVIGVALAGVGSEGAGSARDINLGLDLAGGVSITYTADKADPTEQEISDTIYKLQRRISEQGYTEGEVYREGSDRINVDIPNVSDPNQVLADLGKPGNLTFVDQSGNVVITGEDVVDANPVRDSQSLGGGFYVRLELNAEGAEKFAQGTRANVNKVIHILYNDEVLMSPVVSEEIRDGVASISGLGTLEEASELATSIRIGALPLKLVELRSTVVGAKMGYDAIQTSLKAGTVGLLLLFAFLLLVYRVPGLVATVALSFYAALMVAVLSLGGITLTLPGIAGIILSIGMAVDANVIVFARIKEELAMEKTLRASIKAGFKKASSAIVDGNVTTLIAAGVLFAMGTGTIKGFATTLAIGIIISLFTALVVTRILLVAMVEIGFKKKTLYGHFHVNRKLPIIDRRKLWLAVSAVAISVGLVALPVNMASMGSPFNFDIEFVGGTSTLVTIDRPYASFEELQEDVRDLVVEATGDQTPRFNNVEGVNGQGQFVIRTKALDTDTRIALEEALAGKYGITSAEIQSESISATIGSEMQRDAVLAVLIAALGILVYITFRFRDYRFGLAAVIALVHDVLVMLAVYAVLRIPVNNSFIAAMLTIIGYSINDTIVVFDRVRENQRHMKKGDYQGLVDSSVAQTLARSVNTSFTTFIMILSLYVLGVASIREFALPLMVGILSGTYSSIFVASPLWYLFKKREEAKLGASPGN
ncbi:protein translocase subunit SecD [Anaerotalea alkaliphila]|uniref:Multifunctional fusion protein n=1 Tax=Anaerotalea alkaliphila TaxID=2662126 RepID=A0A7X5HVU5_9FIRM|nr:protein translocase subunit SecD [Anaerotalea alkaliphila]NDL67595.1 protein translocase subunit SecD [Anaerotalea alkaliphila]